MHELFCGMNYMQLMDSSPASKSYFTCYEQLAGKNLANSLLIAKFSPPKFPSIWCVFYHIIYSQELIIVGRAITIPV